MLNTFIESFILCTIFISSRTSKWFFFTYGPSLSVVFISPPTFSLGFYLPGHNEHSCFSLCHVISNAELLWDYFCWFPLIMFCLFICLGFLDCVLGIVFEILFVGLIRGLSVLYLPLGEEFLQFFQVSKVI